MLTLLPRHAEVLVTMDGAETPRWWARRPRRLIEQVGPTAQLPSAADEVVDLRRHVVLPSLVNTHHHCDQSPPAWYRAPRVAVLFDG